MINFDDRILEQVTPEEFWLLAHIAKRLSSDMTCFPSNAKLLQDTKWKDERTLQKVKKQLISKGLIGTSIRFKAEGGQSSNLYTVKTDYVSVTVKAKRITETIDTNGGTQDAPPPPASDVPLSINQLSFEPIKGINTPPVGDANDFVDFEQQIKTKQSEAHKAPPPPTPPPFCQSCDADVTELLETLNTLANRCYTVTGERAKSNRDFVLKLLKKKYTKDEINAVIQTKCFEWVNNVKMSKFLRPSTLFGSNFQTYLEEYNNLKSNPHFAEQFKKNVNATKPSNTAFDTAQQIADSVARLRAEGY